MLKFRVGNVSLSFPPSDKINEFTAVTVSVQYLYGIGTVSLQYQYFGSALKIISKI